MDNSQKYMIFVYFSILKHHKIVLLFLHAFLNLVTSLLKPQEPGLHFKNTKKIILFVPISRITKFYLRCIPDIKEKIKKIC
jgi:hypothetical protein